MELARTSCPEASVQPPFISLMGKIYFRIGDLHQLRWLFNTALGLGNSASGTSSSSSSSFTGIGSIEINTDKIQNIRILSDKEKLLLYNEYLSLESLLGQSDTKRLDELRTLRNSYRNKITTELIDKNKSNIDMDKVIGSISIWKINLQNFQQKITCQCNLSAMV